MKKQITFALCLLVLASGFSACKRVKSVTKESKETITTIYKDGTKEVKTFEITPPSENAQATIEEESEEPKRLSNYRAKKMLREKLEKENGDRLTAKVRIGYFECNDYEERLKLYKLAANNIIDMQVDEIVTEYGPTYWVTTELTWRGKWLRESPRKPVFPEDAITDADARAFLIPALDQDEWGIPSTDTIVPAVIKTGMKAFYTGLQAGQSYDKSLMDANMVCAMRLLDSLASYGVDKLGLNPFIRDAELTPEAVENMSVLRLPRLENAYLVIIGEKEFIYVLTAEENVVIEDLAYISLEELTSYDQTVCSLAGTLTKEEIIAAREMKRYNDEMEAKMREAMANMPQDEAAEEEKIEDFEMCETEGALRPVVHEDPTLYCLAKQAENYEDVELLGAKVKVIIAEKEVTGNKKNANANVTAYYEQRKVNAVGRIYLGLTDGTKTEKNISFIYSKKDGWKINEAQ